MMSVDQIGMLVGPAFREGWRVAVWSAQREIGFRGTYPGDRLGEGIFGRGREEEEELWLVRVRESAEVLLRRDGGIGVSLFGRWHRNFKSKLARVASSLS